MAKRKEHGQRNQRLAIELHEGKVYYDWVVTTAFYSSIHFVEEKIFPCEVRGIQCKNIADARKAYGMAGRHATRERLVWSHCPQVAAQYKWLDDKSRYARYTTYKVTVAEAEKALQYLKAIRGECAG